MQIRAAVLTQIGLPPPYANSRPLRIETLDLAPPGPGEVLVKIAAAGLCHSDLSVINGDRPRPLPMALGHEAAGVILETAPDVTTLRPGDHVVLVFVPSCGRCLPCMEGRPALCEPGAAANTAGTLLSGHRRLKRGQDSLFHHLGVSAFADHAVVAAQSCIKIDPAIDLAQAALFGCAVLTGMGAVANAGCVKPGSTVAVVGLGGVGLAALLGALAAGARSVIALDLNDAKLHIAKSLGATAAINAASPDAIDQVKTLTQGGVDVAFEMAGAVSAMELAYRITRRGGTTVTAGLSHPARTWPLQHLSLVAEERTIKGCYLGSCVPLRDIPRYLGLFQAGRLPVDKLLGQRLALADLNPAFDRLATGNSLRDLVIF